MTFGTVILVLGFMSPSAFCLTYAWRARVKLGTEFTEHGWRAGALIVGLMAATLSQLLATAFLLIGFHSSEQSFAERVSLPWAIANWIMILTWLLALATVALGRGSLRRSLLICGLVMRVTSWIIFMMGYDY